VKRTITPGASYEIELPKDLKARGIYPVFHASLLRYHVPVDDRRFPGRDYSQIATLGDTPQEWAVDRITSHKGKGRDAIFEILWKTGDRTWEPYRTVRHLSALDAYCEAQGVPRVGKLAAAKGDELFDGEPEELESNHIRLVELQETDKTKGQTHLDNPPTPPISLHPLVAHTRTYLHCASEDDTMSQCTTNDLTAILKTQNDALIRMASTLTSTTSGPKRTKPKPSHRQRNAKRKEAREASGDPGRNYGRRGGREGERKDSRSGKAMANKEDLVGLLADWPGNAFDATSGATLTAEDLLTASGNDLGILQMAYAPPLANLQPALEVTDPI
jgi:hypothetical protein